MRRLPSMRPHSSGQARVTLNGKDFLLGPFGSPEATQAYLQLIAEWEASGRSPYFRCKSNETTIAEVVAAFVHHCQQYYGTDPNSEFYRIKPAMDGILALYSELPASDFSPQKYKALRVHLMQPTVLKRKDGTEYQRPRSRTYVNRLMKLIRRMFRWGASESLCESRIHNDLATVDPLRKGRTTAHENKKVLSVPAAKVEATLPFLTEVVSTMVQFQQLTGCRPGEICALTPAMVDRSNEVWEIKLEEHKTSYAEKDRIVYVGPKAQKLLAPFLLRDENTACFSPRESELKRRAKLSEERTTPLSCGNKPGSNRKQKPGRLPGNRYSTQTYDRAIKYACRKAFPAPDEACSEEIRAWEKANHWAPNQLRHSMATNVRRSDSKKGLEAASILLGHSDIEITKVYAEADRELAIEMIKKIG